MFTKELRELLSSDDEKKTAVEKLPYQERMQFGVDVLKDKPKRDMITQHIREAGYTLERGLRELFPGMPGYPHIIECVMIDRSMDPNLHFVDDLATVQEIQNGGMDFWNKSAETVALRAACEHKFWQNFLGEANIFTGRSKSGLRHNQFQFQEHTRERPEPNVRASGENTQDSVTVDEPVITYLDRPVRDSERTMFNWGIQDIIAEIVPLPAGATDYRQVISDVLMDDETMLPQMELTEGALVSLKISKQPGRLTTYKVGIQVSDEFIAGAIRMNVLMRTQARIGRFFNRACTIRMLNKIASSLQTGATPYGPNYTINSTQTSFTGQQYGEIEDSYEVETFNRIVGKKKAIRAVKEMNMGTENIPYAQYYQRPTQFYDLGMGFADIGLGGINSTQLDSAYGDKSLFTFDVMSTAILMTAPWLEQDEDTRDAPTGSLLTSMRTAVDENVEDPNSIRKANFSPGHKIFLPAVEIWHSVFLTKQMQRNCVRKPA